MVLVVRIPGFAPVSLGAHELDWATADRTSRSSGRLLFRCQRRGGDWELPFDEGKVFMDGIGVGGTGSYRGRAQARCAERSLRSGGEVKSAGYATVKATFAFGLESD